MEKCCKCESQGVHQFEDRAYCEEHYRHYIKKCHKCEELFEKSDGIKSEDGDWYCEDCYYDNYFHCAHCDCEQNIDDGLVYDGDRYCSECFYERFGLCDGCSASFRQDDLRYSEEDDQYYCSECYEHEEGSNHIHDYGYRPDAEFKKLKWEDNLYMGIELEVQNFDNSVREVTDKLVDFLTKEGIEKHFYLKHDGSIGDEGFEIVTHPFTVQYGNKNLKIYKILNWLKRHKFSSHESGKCGLHIHLNKEFFTDLDITKLRIFFSKNKEHIHKFSKRELDSSGHYNHFCQYEEFNLSKFINNEEPEGRYWAINTHHSSRETIEIRVFRGTLSYDRFLASIQFAHAIANFVKIHGITSFLYGEREYKNNSWKMFTDWAKSEKYNHLVSYLEKEKICA